MTFAALYLAAAAWTMGAAYELHTDRGISLRRAFAFGAFWGLTAPLWFGFHLITEIGALAKSWLRQRREWRNPQ